MRIDNRGKERALTGPLLALLASALLTVGVSACGNSSTSTRSASRSASETSSSTVTSGSGATPASSDTTSALDYTKMDGDKDNDVGTSHDDTSNAMTLNFGHAANESDKHAVSALVKRYYAIALAGDGAKACSMIYSPIAESVPEDYGLSEPPGPPYMRGTTCPAVLNGLFKHFHMQLAVEAPKLTVTRVRLIEHHGIALLSFGSTLPERQIQVVREGHTWRMVGLLDRELP